MRCGPYTSRCMYLKMQEATESDRCSRRRRAESVCARKSLRRGGGRSGCDLRQASSKGRLLGYRYARGNRAARCRGLSPHSRSLESFRDFFAVLRGLCCGAFGIVRLYRKKSSCRLSAESFQQEKRVRNPSREVSGEAPSIPRESVPGGAGGFRLLSAKTIWILRRSYLSDDFRF